MMIKTAHLLATHFYTRLCQVQAKGSRDIGRALGFTCGLLIMGGCDAAQSAGPAVPSTQSPVAQTVESRIWMTVRGNRFAITLADTEAAREFVAMLPLSIDMPDLNDNEKHAKLSRPLTTNTIRPGTIHSGDLMLYGSQTLVVFYQSFTSPYSYTRLGRIDDPVRLEKVLGSNAARIEFTQN